MASVRFERSLEGVRRRHARRRPARPRDRGRRVHGARRPVRLRQDDGAADGRRARGHQRRRRPHRRAGRQRPLAEEPRHRDGLPELRALPAPERARQHRVPAEDREGPEGRDRPPRRRRRRASSTSSRTSSASRARSRAASASASRWAARSCASRRCSCMDEPLSNLDAKLRVQMRADIKKLQHDLGTTTIYVTHDQVEAMTMGDRVAVMRKGELQQVAPPQELYDRPANIFVAGFIGSPAMNMLEARRRAQRPGRGRRARRRAARARPRRQLARVRRPDGRASASARRTSRTPRSRTARRRRGCAAASSCARRSGPRCSSTSRSRRGRRSPTTMRELAEDVGDDRVVAQLASRRSSEATLVGRFSPRTTARRTAMPSTSAVDVRALHFFDPDTGLAIRAHDRGARRPRALVRRGRAGALRAGRARHRRRARREVAAALDASARRSGARARPRRRRVAPSRSAALCLEANADDACVGLVVWMHTFSPAKMWIAGLSALQKPLLHLHTQFNRELPWAEIDMDFMNLNQSAHGDREFGFARDAAGRPPQDRRRALERPGASQRRIGTWARAACGWHELQRLSVARFGDNMRQVAVTEGDKVEAQIRLGVSRERLRRRRARAHGARRLRRRGRRRSSHDYDEQLRRRRRASPGRRAARIAARRRAHRGRPPRVPRRRRLRRVHRHVRGPRATCRSCRGSRSQRLMADGYGFGAEGDWKTAALLRAAKVMATGLPGGTSFMEDYTYDLAPGDGRVLGAHMLEVCPSIAAGRPSCEIHPLAIGGRGDPVRLVFTARPGPAVNVALVDLGDRFRLLVNEVDVVEPDARRCRSCRSRARCGGRAPTSPTAAEAWLVAGGPHHTVLSDAARHRGVRRPRRDRGHRARRRRRRDPAARPDARAALESGVLPS